MTFMLMRLYAQYFIRLPLYEYSMRPGIIFINKVKVIKLINVLSTRLG